MNKMNDRKITMAATFLAVVISTLMLVAPALADHSQSAEWKETGGLSYEVGANEDMVTSITVTNDTGDAIDNIQVVGAINPEPTGDSAADSEFMVDNANPRIDDTMSQKIEPGDTKMIDLERTEVNGVVDLYDSDGTIAAGDYTVTTVGTDYVEVTNDSGDSFTVEKVEYNLTAASIPGNQLFVPEGTVVELEGTVTVDLIENTEFIVPEGENVYNVNASENVTLREDGTVYVPDTGYSMDLRDGDNVTPLDGKLEVNISDVRIKLLEDTSFVGTNSPQNVSLPENTDFEILDNESPVNVTFGTETDNMTFTERANDTTGTWNLSNNTMKAAETIPITTPGGYEQNLSEDQKVDLWDSENLIVQEGTDFTTSGTPSVNVRVESGSEVVKKKDKELELVNLDDFTEKPNGWTGQQIDHHPIHEDVTDTGLPYAEITTEDSDDYLDSGSSVDVPIALETEDTTENKSVYVRTTDTEGTTRITTMILNVDAEAPEVEDLSVSPEWANDNTNVDITIEMSETLGVAPDVAVKENNGEYSSISVESSQENTVYTGVYTTGDNVDRDGVATILVENFEDAVGNESGSYDNDSLLNIDRVAPQTANLNTITGWPVDEIPAREGAQTNVKGYLWEGTAEDNYRNTKVNLSDGTVELKYNGQWHTVSPDDTGYWNSEITMDEGKYEIGVKYVDRAGNESEENVENITIDTTAPEISITSDIEGYISDNQPTIEVTIEDELIGIDNKRGDHYGRETAAYEENKGYMVILTTPDFVGEVKPDNITTNDIDDVSDETADYYDIDAEAEESPAYISLTNSMSFDNNNNEVTFKRKLENEMEDGIELFNRESLKTGEYAIYVIAGDNLQTNSESLEFTVDTENPTLDEDLIKDPKDEEQVSYSTGGQYQNTTYTWSGTADEEDSEIVMMNADGEELGNAVVDDELKWEITKDFGTDGYRYIEFKEIDRAGNESDIAEWGSITVDTTPPEIELDDATNSLDGSETSEQSVNIGATVTDEIDDDVKVKISGAGITGSAESDVTLVDDEFKDDVPLKEGSNDIRIVVEDTAGNKDYKEVTVTRTVAPWAMYATIAAIIAIILAALAILRRQ